MTNALDYHSRMAALVAAISRGDYGPLQIEHFFSGRADQPIQVALRDRETRRVILADLLDDGSLVVPASM